MAKRKPPRQPRSQPEPTPTYGQDEPSPDFLSEDDGWRSLQPEYERDVDRFMEERYQEKLDVAMVVARVMTSGDGPELLELLEVMCRAHARNTYEDIVRRDGKQELVDWIRQMIAFAQNN